MYSNPIRRVGTPQCLALHYRVIDKIANQVQYIKTPLIYLGFFIIRYPYSHQYKHVIVIVYWTEYSDEVIHVDL